MTKRVVLVFILSLLYIGTLLAHSTDNDSIFREIALDEFEYQKARDYCQRIYGYYRNTDDGKTYTHDRELQLYRVYEGIFELDVRYHRNEDDGATVIVGRDLVHPDRQSGRFVEFYELKPYTFLEHARKNPKHFTIQSSGDTIRVYSKHGLSGTAVKDTLRKELRIEYNALAPDTAESINLLFIRGHLSHVDAKAVYRLDDADMQYVPQGNLKTITFSGNVTIEMGQGNISEVFREFTELYIDSVAYLTKDEYKADRKQSKEEQLKRCGYTEKDIDRLKQKLGVPPLTAEQKERIEDQRDWEDDYELMMQADKRKKALTKAGEKVLNNPVVQKVGEAVQNKVEKEIDRQIESSKSEE